jgi:hypothetical protein
VREKHQGLSEQIKGLETEILLVVPIANLRSGLTTDLDRCDLTRSYILLLAVLIANRITNQFIVFGRL